jgi:hypothetical protein
VKGIGRHNQTYGMTQYGSMPLCSTLQVSGRTEQWPTKFIGIDAWFVYLFFSLVKYRR